MSSVHDVTGLGGVGVHGIDVFVRFGDGVVGDARLGEVVVLALDTCKQNTRQSNCPYAN